MNKKFEGRGKTLEIEGLSYRKGSGEFLNHDVRRGCKDGRKAPDAWSFSLQAIEAEEVRFKDDFRSVIRQTQADASTNLSHKEYLLKQNNDAEEGLMEDHKMIAESVAQAQHSAAYRDLFIAGFLTCLDAFGLIIILKKIFGGNICLIVPLGILLISAVVFGIKTLLEYQNPEKRTTTGKILVYVGGALVVVGLIGVALLRSVTFNAALAGDGAINIGEISMGNLLFTVGIGIGLPLILGVWFESESSKMKCASIPLMLYAEERLLLKARTALLAKLKRLQEIDNSLDGITPNIIRLRQSRYARGYIKGVRKNQNARQYIEEILKNSQDSHDQRASMPKLAGAWGR